MFFEKDAVCNIESQPAEEQTGSPGLFSVEYTVLCLCVYAWKRELVCQVWEILFLLHMANLAKLIWVIHIQMSW